MLWTADWLIPCQPKSGSTTRREVYAPLLGAKTRVQHGGRVYEGHVPPRELPAEVRGDRRVIAVVREPGAWYWSLWCHLRVSPPGSAAYEALRVYGGGSVTWERVLYGWTHPSEVEPVEWHAMYAPGPWTEEPLWSRSVRWYYEGADVFIQAERQAEALSEVLGVRLPPTRINVSGSEPEWTAERRRWVEAADGYTDQLSVM